MSKKPWLSASGEAWDKRRMQVLVRDNFTCQWQNIRLFVPNPALYNADVYQQAVERWQSLQLTAIERVCTYDLPETRLRSLQVHHIIQRVYFLPYQQEGHDLSNLVTICAAHHEQIHPHMRHMRHMPLKTPSEEYGLRVPTGWTVEE